MSEALYKQQLLDHARKPRNKGDLSGADRTARGSNPRCGDEIELGLYLDADRIERIEFRGRGCSICIASASLLTEAACGRREEVLALCENVYAWLDPGNSHDQAPCESLQALGPVRAHRARQRCALLSWGALRDALTQSE